MAFQAIVQTSTGRKHKVYFFRLPWTEQQATNNIRFIVYLCFFSVHKLLRIGWGAKQNWLQLI